MDVRSLMKHAKLPSLFSAVSFVSILFLIIFVNSFISNISLQTASTSSKKAPDILFFHSRKIEQLFEASSTELPLHLTTERSHDEEGVYGDDQGHLIAPVNVTEEARIAWFKTTLPEFEIFKSTKVTEQFDTRAKNFFNKDCGTRFFMTWISPVTSFGRRENFAMESLFKSHPNGCLMIVSKTMDSNYGYDTVLKPILDKGFKVVAVSPDLNGLVKDTPAESWLADMKTGENDPGEIPLAQNLSNLLRLVLLYKYGGVYIDTDFIVLKDFSPLKNTIGAQSMDITGKNWTRLNNAVLIFDKKHPLLYKFIEEFALTFDGNKWGHNGPYLVSRVVEKVANRPEYNFTVLPPIAFYPVDWTRIGTFFKQPSNAVDSKWVEAKLLQLKGESYGLHLWNKQSSRLKIEETSIIERVISNHCIICDHIYSSRKIFI